MVGEGQAVGWGVQQVAAFCMELLLRGGRCVRWGAGSPVAELAAFQFVRRERAVVLRAWHTRRVRDT